MEQRRLRLGDIVDDYCPRERRVTNHAIVAMIEDDVKQTRCTTCDAEHTYKGGQAPRKRRKDATSTLYQEVLAGMPDTAEASVPRAVEAVTLIAASTTVDESAGGAETLTAAGSAPPPAAGFEADRAVDEVEVEPERSGVDEGPIHRRLIRATLPRPEGQKEVRQAPDFTIQNGRPVGAFRGDRTRGHAGNGSGSGMRRRFGGGGQAGPSGGRSSGGGRNRPGFGGGNGRGPAGNPGRPQGGRKRSR